MHTSKLSGLIYFCASNVAIALPCDNFQLIVKNNSLDNLVVLTSQLDKANVTPKDVQIIKKESEQEYTIDTTPTDVSMNGEWSLYTLSIPSKIAKIKFQLRNIGGTCKYTKVEFEGNYNVKDVYKDKQVVFSINAK